MKNKLIQAWYAVRYSLWFVPVLLTAAACLLAVGTVQGDMFVAQHHLSDFWWLYSGSPEGARAVLSTIAGSMITVAGVVFSLTMVVLSLTSSQFGPRLVRNFMDDTGNQLVLGTFVATFVYCVIVLRTVEGAGEHMQVPHLSVTVGVGLALTSLAVLIYFIHHIASSIQANNLMAHVGRDLESTIKRLCPQELDREHAQNRYPEPPELPQGFEQRAAVLWAHESGYLKMVDHGHLFSVAQKRDLLIKVLPSTGDFLVSGEALALVHPPEAMGPGLARSLSSAFSLGVARNESQDLIFPAQLLAETALRALSPGVNDPFTAVTCIDWLASGMALLAGRVIPEPVRRDDDGEPRVLLTPVTMRTIIHQALDPIRRAARDNQMCTLRLLGTLATLARQSARQDDVEALSSLALRIKEDSLSHIKLAWDRQEIADSYEKLVRLLDEASRRCAAREGSAA
ncbi:MAG: DUF2254 domain-containing protein [Desulfarculaceae bacterium]|nr:DUF2254 domain-containing protein [Desulfarculaceae bacterium]MCF8074142.1 DUF2254 domain-containing protein [Desulfarculaceae bacterium]MCF8103266.1 DUF2254 domain-containing protein [Desulfarculaceae bacterium]MCF8116876.1 DUF2254 domain-containing protein [Desulfarculaceae bacterium]